MRGRNALDQHGGEVFNAAHAHGMPRFNGGGTEMRQQRDILKRHITGMHAGFPIINIQASGTDMAGFQRC